MRPNHLGNVWVVRHIFVDDEGRPTPRWWCGLAGDDVFAFGEPEDAENFGRRIDAEEAFRRIYGRIDKRTTRAQRLTEALAEVGVSARLSGTTDDGRGTPVAALAGSHAP